MMTIDRNEAFSLMLASCPSFGIDRDLARYVSAFEEPDEPDVFTRVGALAHHVVALIEKRDLEEVGWVLSSVERVLAEGDEDAVELVVLGFLEPLRNIVSHDDVAVAADELAAVLGPDAAAAWAQNERLWEAAARWRGLDEYRAVDHPDLRRYLRSHKRRMTDGVLLGAADVVRYQQRVQGLSPPGGRRRLPWLAIAVGLAMVVLTVVMVVR
jgi:hypothetical protein